MSLVHAKPKFWTRDEYYRLIESGILGFEARFELIEGEIVPMASQGPEHSHTVTGHTTRFVRLFGDTHLIRVQCPLDLGNSQPQPDFSFVLIGTESASHLPTTADLVIEVAKTSLSFDRNEKANVYAKAGIPELWILNPKAKQVEVHRRPATLSSSSYGYGYASVELFSGDETFSPLFQPSATFTAAELVG